MVLPDYAYSFKSRRHPITRGYSRRALSFNGTTQNIRVLDDPTLRPATLTVSIWHRLLSPLAAQPDAFPALVGKRVAAPQFAGFALYYNRAVNNFAYSFGNGVALFFPVILITWDVLKWTYTTFRHNGVTGEIMINGVSRGTLVQGFVSAVTNLFIASIIGITAFPYADLDGATFYNRWLTDEEIRYNMLNYHSPIRNGLQMWLPFEEGQGLTAVDLSGTGNNGSLLPVVNPPPWIRTSKHELRAEALI